MRETFAPKTRLRKITRIRREHGGSTFFFFLFSFDVSKNGPIFIEMKHVKAEHVHLSLDLSHETGKYGDG